jgi:tetratricopeptide (TPR) repeat protein
MTPMPPPAKIAGIGGSHLQITTKSAEAQAYFDQGLSLLHCFWDFEAYRAFKEAARLDPNAAMAYWGMVEAIADYDAMEDEKDAALAKAKALTEKASEHEQYYLRAQRKKQDDDDDEGAGDWEREMEALIDKHPDDINAKLFLAMKTSSGYDKSGRPRKGTVYAQMLLSDVLKQEPESAAAHHYRIHVLESGDRAQEAVADAEALSKLAPGSGHMVHMPGHIYYKLGDYQRARSAFFDSMRVDEEYMQRAKVGTLDDWNYAHNLSYLIASDVEAGRYREALAMAEKLEKLPANPFLAKGTPTHVLTVGGSTARLNARYGNWRAMIDNPIRLGMDDAEAGEPAAAYRDRMLAYARGMLAVTENGLDAAQRESDALDAISWRLHAEKSGEEKDRSEHVLDLLEMLSLDLRGNLLGARGKTEEAAALLKKALTKETEIGYSEPPQYGRPEAESLGYVYLRGRRFADARAAFADALKVRPHSGHALYGLAQCLEAEGDAKAAARAYRDFLVAWKDADPDLPMVKHAQSASN